MDTVNSKIFTPSPLHILHLSYTLARPIFTDPEEWLKRVAFVSGVPEKLVAYGPQTVIYNIHYKGEVQRNGVRYLFPGFRRWELVLPFAFNRLVRSLKPDVVLVHGLIFPWQIIMLRETVGPHVKIICQHHAERPFRDFRKYFAKRADKYIGAYLFASKTQGEEWVKAGQISSIGKVHEVMGTSSIFYFENKQRAGKSYLWIGDLDTNKDPVTAVRAFVEFSRSRPDVTLNMIYQKEQLLNEVKEIANQSIHFVGKVNHSEMQSWFNKSDFIISTSHYEGSGIAVCEAMSCGCIPILTSIPSFTMMTANWKVGRSFIAGKTDSLVAALEKPFDFSESQRVIDHFKAELSFEANARKIMNIVQTL